MEFLLSNYECQWGRGCKGINPNRPDLGCCANGAYLNDKDVELLKKRVPQLDSETWQRHGSKFIHSVPDGSKWKFWKRAKKTAIVDRKDSVSGCVFANDPDFAGGAGCTLHIAAMKQGENPIDWKPMICWQMPLFVEEVDEINTNIVRMFHWSKNDYPWFCAHDEISWIAEKPVYQTMAAELKAMLDDYDESLYEIVVKICDASFKQSAQWRGEKPFIRPVPVSLKVV